MRESSHPIARPGALATVAQLLAAAEDGASPGDSAGPTERAAARVLRTLIVEDAKQIADRLVELVSAPGAVEVMAVAATEALALAACESQAFDLAVVDLQLAQGTGFAVIRRLRANDGDGHRACIVVLTNHAVPALKIAAFEAGADHFFDKSKDFSSIPRVIRELLKGRDN
jgi:two-component system, OmpR family, response regulator